jgi:hypothetical protein
VKNKVEQELGLLIGKDKKSKKEKKKKKGRVTCKRDREEESKVKHTNPTYKYIQI